MRLPSARGWTSRSRCSSATIWAASLPATWAIHALRRPVTEMLTERLPVTIELALTSLFIATPFGMIWASSLPTGRIRLST